MNAVDSTLREYESRGATGAYAVAMWRAALSHAACDIDTTQGALPYVPAPFEDRFAGREGLLDIGCLGGYGLYDLLRRRSNERRPGRHFVGLDVDGVSVALANRMSALLPELRAAVFLKGSACELPFGKESFGGVIARLVLPYVPIDRSLSEMVRVLKVNGLLLLQVHGAKYYLRQAWHNKGRLKLLFYYMKPVVCGSIFRLTGRQFVHPLWMETAISTRALGCVVRSHGLRILWVGGPEDRPMVVCEKCDAGSERCGLLHSS